MNDLSCPLCKEKNINLITRRVRFEKSAEVYSCTNCSLFFLDQGSFTYPHDFYEREYHQTYITHVEPDALNPENYYEKMKKSTKIWADRFIGKLTPDDTVLDVGCSTGHFLDSIRAHAKAVYGHELNRKEIEYCRNVRGLDVSDSPLENRFEKETFDYITMIYVLEHIALPVPFLNHLKQFLKPEGRFVILVPNVLDPLVNFYEIPEFKEFYFCIEHLYYFNPTTLDLVFRQAGLAGSIETLQEYPMSNHLNWGYRRKPSDTLASRLGIPDIQLSQSSPMEDWEKLWKSFDKLYKQFLSEHGYGDRIWAVVGK